MKIRLAFSSCPNDTFIFDAMIHHKIDTEGLTFDYHIADVEELNTKAILNEFDVTKLSMSAYFKMSTNYVLLNSGNALGKGCGPLLISKKKLNFAHPEQLRVAIPGIHTTANLLLSLFMPMLTNKQHYLFSQIEDAVAKEWVDAGLIIHENRFTYEQKELLKVVDLGDAWEKQTQLPIPLGCIAARRWYHKEFLLKLSRVIQRSLIYAFSNPHDVMPFVKKHAWNLDDKVIKQHIDLYVNSYTFALSWQAFDAIRTLANKAEQIQHLEIKNHSFFIKDLPNE